mmetsp:Transcript_28523/g.45741  ORF Transcript_28523/g.45741 Transcript_28523/m.45741 type:complete len:259 (-) Transcript_28523:103-879(-)
MGKAEKAREIIFFVFVLYPVHSKILRRAVRAATSTLAAFSNGFLTVFCEVMPSRPRIAPRPRPPNAPAPPGEARKHPNTARVHRASRFARARPPNAPIPPAAPGTMSGAARTRGIVRVHGKPDLFITFMCNPQWPEILAALQPGQIPADRPDIVARVFKLKLEEFLDDIGKGEIFGELAARMHVVEFQKRGLPHVHILLNGQTPTGLPPHELRLRAEMPFMVRNLEAHVNVEVCTSVNACKYLLKYIHKGGGRAMTID